MVPFNLQLPCICLRSRHYKFLVFLYHSIISNHDHQIDKILPQRFRASDVINKLATRRTNIHLNQSRVPAGLFLQHQVYPIVEVDRSCLEPPSSCHMGMPLPAVPHQLSLGKVHPFVTRLVVRNGMTDESCRHLHLHHCIPIIVAQCAMLARQIIRLHLQPSVVRYPAMTNNLLNPRSTSPRDVLYQQSLAIEESSHVSTPFV